MALSNSGMSNLMLPVYGSLRVITNSLLAEMDRSIKMHKYIRFGFVWFILDESSKTKIPVTYFLWKSSRIVKSSKTC